MVELREIIPLVVLVTAGMLLFVAISDQWTENELAETDGQLEYLQCLPMSRFGDVERFVGPAEGFEFEGEEWIRITGTGKLTVWTDGKARTYDVKPATLGLVLLTGQSNSVYYTNPSYYPAADTLAPGNVFYFGTTAPTSDTLGCAATPQTMAQSGIHDIVAPDGTLRMSQMYPSFCQDWLKEKGERILIVNTGIGGMSIRQWDIPSGTCSAWMTSCFEYLKKAVEEDGRISLEPLAVLWSQGESDYNKTQDWYYERLVKLVDNFEDGAWGYSFPYVLSTLPRHPDRSAEIPPALAQEALAEADDRFVIASSLAVEFGPHRTAETRDGIHFTQKVYGWFGEAFARSLAVAEGLEPVRESIVFVKALEDAEELPAKVTAYGTSGASFELDVEWTETDTEGTYSGTLSGNPEGTAIAEGLAATITIITPEEEA